MRSNKELQACQGLKSVNIQQQTLHTTLSQRKVLQKTNVQTNPNFI